MYLTFSVEVRKEQSSFNDNTRGDARTEIALPEFTPYNCIDTGKIFEYLIRSAVEDYEKNEEENEENE